jgi:hypothetical protein
MEREIICEICGMSKEFYKLIPKTCFNKQGYYVGKHRWIKEKLCKCGHGETSHYVRHGIIQCSVGDCFPFSRVGHSLSYQNN